MAKSEKESIENGRHVNEDGAYVTSDSPSFSAEQGPSEPLLPRDGGGEARRRRKTPSAPPGPSSIEEGARDAEEHEGAAWWESAAQQFGAAGMGAGIAEGGDHEQQYDGTFVPPPPIVPVAEPVPSYPDMVRVIAPAAFAAGYEFVATLEDGRAFTVSVTEEDVEEGDEVSVPYPREFLATTIVPPTGHWKDGLCACLRFGCCHPMFCLPWFFPFVALGQVMSRMRLTWLANTGRFSRTKHTFKVLVLLAVIRVSIVGVFGYFPSWEVDSMLNRVLGGMALFLVILQIYLIATTRRRVRQRFEIPPDGSCCCGCCRGCCGDCCCRGCCEDWCCAVFCGCCTVAQMGRHTADYETYRGICCSSSGLPRAAPAV